MLEARATKSFRIVLLLLLQTLHFTHRRFQPTRPLPRRSPPCRRLPIGGCLLLLPFCIQDAHLLARQLQMRFQFLFAAEAIASGISFDFGSVQCHPFQTDQTFGAQHTEYLHEQIIQSCLVFRAEAGQRPMADRLQSTEPLKTWFKLALPRHFSCRTDSPTVGVQPKTDQQLGVGMVAPRPTLDGFNLRVIPAQVQPSH